MDDVYLCHECGKVFYKLSTLESHARWKHNDKTTEFMCDQCGRTFQKKYNLQKHIEVGVHYVAETVRCAAEECNFRAQNRKGMCSHYENYHGIFLNETTIYFNNTEEFFDWKTAYENRTRARFVKMSSSRKRKNGIVKCTYLCHRDGNFIPKGKNIRLMKGKGSNKINAHCPAKMEVDISEKLVTVSYIDTHVGHDLDIFRLSLNPEDKAAIAKMLAMQVPFEEILNDINSSAKNVTDSNGVKRLNLLTRKDLWNIVETFKIDPKTVVYSKSRAKRKRQMGQMKRETKGSRYWLKVMEDEEPQSLDGHQTVGDTEEGDEDAGEDESLVVYPVLVKGENNEYFQKYAVVSDGNIVDGDNNCLIINSQGELESVSGHNIIFSEDGDIQIYESDVGYENSESVAVDEDVVMEDEAEAIGDSGEMFISEEEEVNVCEMTSTGEIIFIDDETYKIEKSTDREDEVVESIVGIKEENIIENVNNGSDIKQDIYDSEIIYTENDEEIEPVERVFVENIPKIENLEYEVTEQDFEEDQVDEYVIISTEEDECNVILEESNEVDKNTSSIMSTDRSAVTSSIDNVSDIFCVKTNEPEPQWQEKRKEVLNKLLNVHSMINNEKQLTVLSKNISSLENVIKSLSENDNKVPDAAVGLES